MAEPPPPAEDTIEVELRNPAVAALLAWLWPGAGHLYQGRIGKGLLFMICILSTWFFGLKLANGHSVYASNSNLARQLVFGCQLGVGLPAAPAIVQAVHLRDPKNIEPLFGGFMAPPNDNPDQLSEWNLEYGVLLDMSVLYTMIAGLLNILAIYDAYGGPLVPAPEEKKDAKKNSDPEAGSGSPKSDSK
jgi:hypothetical protein